jgi:hypothetical protein
VQNSWQLVEVNVLDIISRSEAKAKGLTTYYTGIPCKHGHITIRFVTNGCAECKRLVSLKKMRDKRLNFTEDEKVKYNNSQKVKWSLNKEKINLQRRELWANLSEETKNNLRRIRCIKSLNRQNVIREQARNSYQRRSGKIKASVILSQEKRALRVPLWADFKKIENIYKNCPKGYEVDHIIPLLGVLVSGLHIAENLQYLTPEENRRKRNRFDIL